MEFMHGWSYDRGGGQRAQSLGEGGLLRRGEEVVRVGLFAFQRGMTVSSSDQFGLPA